MSVLVIGVDPGDSTGVAVLMDGQLTYVFQGTPERAVALVELVLERATRSADTITLACERFIQQRSQRTQSHQPRAQQIAGVMQHVAERYAVQFVLQGAADAWAIADNNALRKLKVHQSAKSVQQPDADDANMAVRHALLCLARHHASLFDAILKATE